MENPRVNRSLVLACAALFLSVQLSGVVFAMGATKNPLVSSFSGGGTLIASMSPGSCSDPSNLAENCWQFNGSEIKLGKLGKSDFFFSLDVGTNGPTDSLGTQCNIAAGFGTIVPKGQTQNSINFMAAGSSFCTYESGLLFAKLAIALSGGLGKHALILGAADMVLFFNTGGSLPAFMDMSGHYED